jgi:hypothetical protein
MVPRPRNRDGRPVDPVPFVVVAGLGGMLALSVGPLYGLAYGLSLRVALAVSAAVALAVAAGAYHQLVRGARPAGAPGPTAADADWLLYVAVAFGVVLAGLSVPLL